MAVSRGWRGSQYYTTHSEASSDGSLPPQEHYVVGSGEDNGVVYRAQNAHIGLPVFSRMPYGAGPLDETNCVAIPVVPRINTFANPYDFSTGRNGKPRPNTLYTNNTTNYTLGEGLPYDKIHLKQDTSPKGELRTTPDAKLRTIFLHLIPHITSAKGGALSASRKRRGVDDPVDEVDMTLSNYLSPWTCSVGSFESMLSRLTEGVCATLKREVAEEAGFLDNIIARDNPDQIRELIKSRIAERETTSVIISALIYACGKLQEIHASVFSGAVLELKHAISVSGNPRETIRAAGSAFLSGMIPDECAKFTLALAEMYQVSYPEDQNSAWHMACELAGQHMAYHHLSQSPGSNYYSYTQQAQKQQHAQTPMLHSMCHFPEPFSLDKAPNFKFDVNPANIALSYTDVSFSELHYVASLANSLKTIHRALDTSYTNILEFVDGSIVDGEEVSVSTLADLLTQQYAATTGACRSLTSQINTNHGSNALLAGLRSESYASIAADIDNALSSIEGSRHDVRAKHVYPTRPMIDFSMDVARPLSNANPKVSSSYYQAAAKPYAGPSLSNSFVRPPQQKMHLPQASDLLEQDDRAIPLNHSFDF